MAKVAVPYNHDPSVLSNIYLAIAPGPETDAWAPAYRDIINGRKVVWIPTEADPKAGVWIRDLNGIRKVKQKDVLRM